MGGKPLGFSDYELTTTKKQIKREKFLSVMDAVVTWPHSARKDDASTSRPLFPPGGLMEQSNASLQRGCQS